MKYAQFLWMTLILFFLCSFSLLTLKSYAKDLIVVYTANNYGQIRPCPT